MKQLLQSSFVVLMLVVLTCLAVVNTCQLNNLETQVLQVRKAVEEAGKTGGHAQSAAGRTDDAVTSDAEEAAALAEPNNILKRENRKKVTAAQVAWGGTLRRQEGQDPPGFNRYASNNAADLAEFVRYMGGYLAERHVDDPDKYAPRLAIKITTPDNGLTYDITLRKGVMWPVPAVDFSSGRYDWLKSDHEVTADDFAFALDIIANPQISGGVSGLRNYFDAFKTYEIINKHQLRLNFKERLFTNLGTVLEDLLPMPRWLYMYDEDGRKFDNATWGLKFNEHWFNQKFIGVGPYKFVEWVPGVRIVMERNDRYFGERPAFDRVITLIVKDQTALPRRLRAKDLDYTHLQPEQYRTEVLEAKGPILGQKGIKLGRVRELGYFYLGWNMDSPMFSDKRVRQAMTMAMDRASIVKNVFSGLGSLTTGPIPSASPCYDKTIKPWPYDLKAAAAKLDEAGWKDSDGDGVRDKLVNGKRQSFEFRFVTYGSSNEWTTVASIYREALLQIGIKMNAQPLEWSTMLKKLDEREFDAYSAAWAVDWDTDLMQIWHSKEADRPKSSNRIGFRNKEADRLAEALRAAFDPKEREALCHQFHRLVHEEQPYTFIYERERPVLYWDYMNDLEFARVRPHKDVRLFSFKEARP